MSRVRFDATWRKPKWSVQIVIVVAGLAVLIASFASARAAIPANSAFDATWGRTDQPVASGRVNRTWMWGPEAFTAAIQEPYRESPAGMRMVQYFDKTRMELTYPDLEPTNPFYVTNGLLVVEMVEGHYQVGDAEYDTSADPAAVNITGDPAGEEGMSPTYADINRYGLRSVPADPDGATIIRRIDGQGNVRDDSAMVVHNVYATHRVQVPGIDHQVASVFFDFLNSSGMVYTNGTYGEAPLFEPWYYASGYPITEAYWSLVEVGGETRDVLWQCFERRCLTYTPGNPDGYRVEAGNVGQHYYRWRYESGVTPQPTPSPSPEPSPSPSPSPSPAPDMPGAFELTGQWGGPYEQGTTFSEPRGIALDRDGNVYIADSKNHQIQKYTEDGVFLMRWGAMGTENGQFNEPDGLAIGPDGNLYVSDVKNNRIQVFDTSGAYLRSFDGTASANGPLASPRGVAINSNGFVFVADSGNNRIIMFSLEGEYRGEWNGIGTPSGPLAMPFGIAIDRDNLIYVADTFNHRVIKYDAIGTYLAEWGALGSGNGQFRFPQVITGGEDGRIYVGDSVNNRVQTFNTSGGYLREWSDPGFTQPSGIASAGNAVYVSGHNADRVSKFTLDGELQFGWSDARRGAIDIAQRLTVDHLGRIHVTESLNLGDESFDGRLLTYDLEGALLNDRNIDTILGVEGTNPAGVAVTRDGMTFVTLGGDQMMIQWINGSVTRTGGTGDGPDQFREPDDMAIDADGNLYVVERGNARIQKFAVTDSTVTSRGSFGTEPGLLEVPEGIAIFGERVYVTDSATNMINVFDLSGTLIEQWNGGEGAGNLTEPRGVATDSNGYVYVTEVGGTEVKVFTPEGSYITSIGTSDGLKNTADVAVSEAGTVYVLDAGNHLVRAYTPVNQ